MASAFIVSLLLLGVSGLLLDSHRRQWQTAKEAQDLSDRERRFALAQYRRRMQASGIIGVIGVAIGVGPLIPREPGPMSLYLATLLGACVCILLMAMLDIWATRQHFRRLKAEQVALQLKLVMELKAARDSSEADARAAPTVR